MGFPFDPLTVICTDEMPSFTSLTSIRMLEAGVCVTCADADDGGGTVRTGILAVLPAQINAADDGLSGAVVSVLIRLTRAKSSVPRTVHAVDDDISSFVEKGDGEAL